MMGRYSPINLKYLIEYIALRGLWALLMALPLSWAFPLGQRLGRLWFRLDRRRRSIAVDNVLRSGLAADRAAAIVLARDSFGHFLGHMIESMRLPATGPARAGIEYEAPPETLKLLTEPGEPVLLLSGHLGSWETAIRIFPTARGVMVVARRLNNPHVQRFLDRKHFRGNIELIPKQNGLSADVIRHWNQGRILILLMDQHAGRHGIWLDFFGRPAATHTSPARLHLRTGHPIICAAFLRTGPQRYRLVAGPPVRHAPTGDREADTRTILMDATQQIEALIRRYPEQYLWAHRRWRTPPPDSAETRPAE
jgi:KDO2-lipid IV(A) lauroyltransferase